MKGNYLLNAIARTPWAITLEGFGLISEVALRHATGERLTPEEVRAVIGAARLEAELHAIEAEHLAASGRGSAPAGAIAVLPMMGSIVPRGSLVSESSGLVSAESFGRKFQAALADTNVGGIVIDVNSPGGAVSGVEELSADIYRARGQKPVMAIANHLAASAAYWIGTAADELWVTPSGQVGSIGVFAAHEDWSKALEMEGIKTTLVSAGKYKVEGNPYEPLTDESRASIQKQVDDFYGMFTKAVARNRGVPVADVRGGFGEGRVVGAQEAVKLGMADRVGTMAEVMAAMSKRLASGARVLGTGRSEAEDLDIRRRRARALTQ